MKRTDYVAVGQQANHRFAVTLLRLFRPGSQIR